MTGRVELRLDSISYLGSALTVRWSVGAARHVTKLRYRSVDLDELAYEWGRSFVDRLAFHIAMFEINKGISLGPEVLTVPDRWLAMLTPALAELWTVVAHRIWAQWRYENDRMDYVGPRLPLPVGSDPARTVAIAPGAGPTLWFCGGGKDSLVTGRLLQRLGGSYDALVYTHSVYGPADEQFALVEPVTEAGGARAVHRLDVTDTALPGMLAGETPASLFAALPIALAHGFTDLVVGHERSAGTPNVLDATTGEPVNHQWGKSLAAERLLSSYVADHLVSGIRYFSMLSPVHDPVIFAALAGAGPGVASTHSCNSAKPWCRRCAKCAYVWLGYRAWLEPDVVFRTFGAGELTDDPANRDQFRRLLGLDGHRPFDCVGEPGEARLALAVAVARGLGGTAVGLLAEVAPVDVAALAERYGAVEASDHNLPPDFAAKVVSLLDEHAEPIRKLSGKAP